MRKISFAIFFYTIVVLLIAMLGCTEKYPATLEDDDTRSQLTAVSGCVDCHLDEALLQKVATPLPPSNGSGGEG